MAKFNLVGVVTVSTYTTIEADSLEEALELAERRHDMMHISSNNADSPEDVWMIDEIDGTPYKIKLED